MLPRNRRWVTPGTPATFNCILTISNSDSDIFEVLWELKKKGLKEQIIRNNGKLLKFLAKRIVLGDSEKVKGFLTDLCACNFRIIMR